MSDALMQLLADLPTAEPDRTRAERVRAQCRRRLEPRQPRPAPAFASTSAWRLFVAGLGAAYFVGAILEAVRVFGLS